MGKWVEFRGPFSQVRGWLPKQGVEHGWAKGQGFVAAVGADGKGVGPGAG